MSAKHKHRLRCNSRNHNVKRGAGSRSSGSKNASNRSSSSSHAVSRSRLSVEPVRLRLNDPRDQRNRSSREASV